MKVDRKQKRLAYRLLETGQVKRCEIARWLDVTQPDINYLVNREKAEIEMEEIVRDYDDLVQEMIAAGKIKELIAMLKGE